jgi:hypothetical protein
VHGRHGRPHRVEHEGDNEEQAQQGRPEEHVAYFNRPRDGGYRSGANASRPSGSRR